jgi:hypothetical protein
MSWAPPDFLVEDLEYVTPAMYYHYPGSQALMTVGMEIEQKPTEVDRCRQHGALNIYDWHYDGSGPLETALPPKITYTYEIRRFFREVEKCYEASGKWFEWTNEFEKRAEEEEEVVEIGGGEKTGCGSHLHFRPREDVEQVKQSWVDSWRIAYDTIFTTSIILLPALCFGRSCREGLREWAPLFSSNYPPVSREKVEFYLRDSYIGHPYGWLAWNRHYREKPLTLELRAFEGHPAQAMLAISLIQKVVKVALQRGRSVMFTTYVYVAFNDRLDEWERIRVYDCLREIKEPKFARGYELPYVPRREYEDMLELFRELLFSYTTRTMSHMRVAALLAVGGDVKRNYPEYWRVFAEEGAFCWREPELCDEEIRRMFGDRETYWSVVRKYGEV